ncbi:SGNH hydrolase-type esterase domain-containing protein [Aspergillus filifer]
MQPKSLFRACSLAVLFATLDLTHAETRIKARTPIANGAELRVLPLGDSITHGYLSSDNNGYRLELWNDLSENTKDFIGTQPIGDMQDPDNEGYNGATISEIASKCGAALDMRPNVVLLHAGTNDMNRPSDPDTAPERLGELIDQIITCPDAAVLVAKIIPATNTETMARIDTYNSQVPDVVAARANKGKQVMVVDMTVLTTAELNDGLHPTDAGYKHMGDIWYSAIVEAGEKGWISDPVPGLVPSTGSGSDSCSLLPVWYPQNEIASGIGSSEAFTSLWHPKGEIASGVGAGTGVRFGDIDGDGRDDYLWVDDDGAATLYLNTAGDTADDVVWMPQGVIATGIGEDGDGVRFADMNGDGRDDYLWISDDGKVTCYLNTPGDSPGKPTWVPKGEIASGVGSRRDRILFGDINGDGRDDYLAIGDNGQVDAWLNTGTSDTPVWVPQGQIASGIGAAAGVRIADLNKDGRADYIWLSDEGAATLYTNTLGADGILWWPQGVVATGVGAPRANITFADLNGDGLSDYVSIGPNGEVSEWQNGGSGGVSQIGPGVQFQDLDGDGYDDYVSVDAEGKVVAYINGGVIENKQIWYPQGEIATGVGASRDQVRFGDLDGDGRVEYLFVHDDGSVDSWRNLGSDDDGFPGRVTWYPQGQIASGIGEDGKGVRFADLNGTHP